MTKYLSILVFLALAPGCAMFGGKDGPEATLSTQERVRVGFVELGASEAKSACFADRLAQRLPEDRLARAAEIVEGAE
ncbi:MAG: hypothetical protein AAGL49_11860, partial [Pseudomonadota bacterium]